MGAAYFYHLTHSPVEETLPMLLSRCAQAGWRVAVRARTEALLTRLDERLWTHPPDGFLPHGLAGGPHDADQPVLLTLDAAVPNRAACVMSLEGAEISADEARTLERVCILFDGHNEISLETARGQWRMLTEAGIAAQYWAQDDGGWTKKAEKPAG